MEHAMSEEIPRLNPAALSLEQAAKVLSTAGRTHVSVEMLRQDIADGAPTNTDGTLNLVFYAAWLVKGRSNGD
jgi:hypothetical protein